MAFWWVNHHQTHKHEIEGGYIWSPKRNKNGARNETYLNLTKARAADVVFSYAMGEIRAVGIVETAYHACDRPAYGCRGWCYHAATPQRSRPGRLTSRPVRGTPNMIDEIP
jgi:hypothetical protein